jgi:hypothetical protein
MTAWRGARAMLLVAAAVSAAGCSRTERPAGRAGLGASPAVVTPGQPAPRAPQPLRPPPPPPPPASAPAGEPESQPASMPDVFAAPPTSGSVITDAEGRRFPVNQALVTVAAGTSREEVEKIAASVSGSVVGQILAANLYQLQLPTKTADELEVALGRLRKEPKVKEATHNLMRRPTPR